jgi:Phage major capsid protein E
MTQRSFTNNFEVIDSTRELNILPQTWQLLGDTGLFKEEFLSQNTVTFQAINGSVTLVTDSVRGSKPLATSNDVRKIHSYALTHHQLVDALYPDDIAGKSAYTDLTQADTEAAAVLRKMTKIRKSFDMTKEYARFKTLVTGQAWAPNGTIVADFYSDFGFTRNTQDFLFGTATTEIVAKCEAVIRGFQDTANDGVIISGVTCYASPVFFAKLIAHAKVQSAYTYFSATEGQSILRNRAGGAGLYRKFYFAGINFIEVATGVNGSSYIPSGEAYFVAETDDDSFVSYFGPANRFGLVNTIAMPQYMWQFQDMRGTEITLEAEMNMLNVLRRPNFVAKGISSN